jgi:hypothetical protein
VDDDEDVEEEDDFKKGDDGEEEGARTAHDAEGDDEDEEKDERTPEAPTDASMVRLAWGGRCAGRVILRLGGGTAVHVHKIVGATKNLSAQVFGI